MSNEADTKNIKEEYDKYVRQYNEFTNNIVYNDSNKIPDHLEYRSLNEDAVTFGTGKNKKVIIFKPANSDGFTLGMHHPSTW